MLVVVSIGTITFCSLEYMRTNRSADKFKNMQSFGVYSFDPEAIGAPVYDNVNLETDSATIVDPTPEPLMSSVEPQLSAVASPNQLITSESEYKFDEDKNAFIKNKNTDLNTDD